VTGKRDRIEDHVFDGVLLDNPPQPVGLDDERLIAPHVPHSRHLCWAEETLQAVAMVLAGKFPIGVEGRDAALLEPPRKIQGEE
jgi:hypothetical protein